MRELTELEGLIYNDGERLIPGITHDCAEEVRHRSSYVFWRAIIELDLDSLPQPQDELRIVDLGCGVGHGCVTLSELPEAQVVGVDVSQASLDYARAHYGGDNIQYVRADLREFVWQASDFDYVVARASIEHVPGGIELMRKVRPRQRLMFDVPFAEPVGRNPHHVEHDVTEEAFSEFSDAELFFQDLDGVTFDLPRKPDSPNVIVCVTTGEGLPKVARSFYFPIPAWGGPAQPKRRNRSVPPDEGR